MPTIYIGNLPYDYTEQQVALVASSVGPIGLVKLIFDNATGRSKGFAFVDYPDAAVADLAVRNLSNYKIAGGRSLRVQYSNSNNLGGGGGGGSGGAAARQEVSVPAGEDPQAFVMRTVRAMGAGRLMAVLREAQAMARQDAVGMEGFLRANPQVMVALVQAGLQSGRLGEEGVGRLVRENEKLRGMGEEQRRAVEAVLALSEREVAELEGEYRGVVEEIRREYG